MNCPNCQKPLNIGKLLATIKSKAKAKASRANGKKGGRPKLTAAKKREIEQWDRAMGCESTDD